jgi:Ax21 family sulfation-dependent quorum factor
MNRSLLAMVLVTAATIPAVNASELSYNYFEAGYARTNLSGLPNSDGWQVGGSVALGSSFHMFGNFSQQEFSVAGRDIDFDQWSVGFGYNHSFSPRADLIARLAYQKVDFGSGFDSEGASFEVGVRGMLGDRFEGWATAGYFDAKRGGGDAFVRLGSQFRFNRTWGLVAEATLVDGENSLFVGPRVTF